MNALINTASTLLVLLIVAFEGESALEGHNLRQNWRGCDGSDIFDCKLLELVSYLILLIIAVDLEDTQLVKAILLARHLIRQAVGRAQVYCRPSFKGLDRTATFCVIQAANGLDIAILQRHLVNLNTESQVASNERLHGDLQEFPCDSFIHMIGAVTYQWYHRLIRKWLTVAVKQLHCHFVIDINIFIGDKDSPIHIVYP